MNSLASFWQHIPEYIDPIVFTVGFFSVHWYALCWLAGFGCALVVALRYRERQCPDLSRDDVVDLFLVLFLGAFLGGHLGYGLLYRPDIFFTDPVGFFLPYSISSGVWSGISGMSFHGGLIGAAVSLFLFVKKRNLPLFPVADLISLVAPLALFFGRIGNFLALELYGRVTTLPLGMYFPGAPEGHMLRHPSALYEALGEGVVLFLLLSFIGRARPSSGYITAWFLMGYGAIRFLIEFFREPDQGLSLAYGVFTRGQCLSFFLVVSGLALLVWLRRKNRGKIGG